MKIFSVTESLRPHLRQLKPYSSARHEFTGNARIFLDANENPFNSKFNRYPDPYQSELKAVISKLKKVPVSGIFLGNGSDEAIDLLIRAFCEPGKDHIITTPPTYGMYRVSAAINNVTNIEIPLESDFSLAARQLLNQINDQTKIIFLCSPNNPTGNSIPTDILKEIVEKSGKLVVVDEAYIDFSVKESMVRSPMPENLVVLQTLSKAYGMAGLRIGLAFGPDTVISILNQIKPPYNISGAAQEAALNSLRNHSILENYSLITSERERLKIRLGKLEMVKKVFPSDANFLLVKVIDAKKCYQHLKDSGIIVRDRSDEINCSNCLRITIGTPEENDELLDSLENFQNH